MKNLYKSISKLSPKEGDIVIVKVPFDIYLSQVEDLKEALKKAVPWNSCLLIPEGCRIYFEAPIKGRHKVYLNNLEYLEYLTNKKG